MIIAKEKYKDSYIIYIDEGIDEGNHVLNGGNWQEFSDRSTCCDDDLILISILDTTSRSRQRIGERLAF